MKWEKAGLVGVLGAAVMFVLMMMAIHRGMAPFNIPPSAAFLDRLGLNFGPLALLVHLGYGAFWSMVLVAVFEERTNLLRGLGLALGLWLLMMVAYSPIIGWGFFGFGHASQLSPDDPLYLKPGPKYLVVTLVLHVIYGGLVGWLDSLWVHVPTHTRAGHLQAGPR